MPYNFLIVAKLIKLSLPLFELGIFLINHIKPTFSSDYLTISTTLFYRCSYFHYRNISYLYLNVILPLVKSYGDISTFTLSPGNIFM